MLYCEQDFPHSKKLKDEIKKKINGYKNQDIKKIAMIQKNLLH